MNSALFQNMFESPDLLHKPQKSALANTIWTMTRKKVITLGKDVSYVLDRGALIHRIPWLHGKTFGSKLKLYTDYVLIHYGKAIVVFDGYENASTKDTAHMRRS